MDHGAKFIGIIPGLDEGHTNKSTITFKSCDLRVKWLSNQKSRFQFSVVYPNVNYEVRRRGNHTLHVEAGLYREG